MDGYSLTNKMRQARRRFRLTATEQALFHELVAVCNGENWSDEFDCSNVELCQALNINKNTLITARATLINAGLIYYQSGKSKRNVSLYSFTNSFDKVKKKDRSGLNTKPDNGTDNSTVDSTVDGTDDRHLYKHKTKHEEKKEKEKLKEKEKEKKDIPKGYELFDFSFVSEELQSCFGDWLEYKRQRGEKYKSQKSLQICYAKLNNLCNGDSSMAEKIIEQSQANNWSGFFELKNKEERNHEYKHPFTTRTTKTEYRDF